MLEQALANSTVGQAPEEMIERYVAQFTQQATLVADNYSASYGYSVTPDYYVNVLMSQDGFTGTPDEYIRDRAVKTSQRYLMLAEIAQKEGISVTEEELEAALQSDLSSESQPYDSIDDLLKALGATKEGYKEELLGRKVTEFLVDNAVVTEPAE